MPQNMTLNAFLNALVKKLPHAPDCFYAIPDATPQHAHQVAREHAASLLAENLGFMAPDRESAIDGIALKMQGNVRAVNENYGDKDQDAINRYAESVIDTVEQAVAQHLDSARDPAGRSWADMTAGGGAQHNR